MLAVLVLLPNVALGQSRQPVKSFKLKPDQIKPLATGLGACLATDRITVEGRKVAFCYREKPDNAGDSGWRFFAGNESDAYLDNPANSGIYDVNTIANYDPEIIPFLKSPVGSAFERRRGTGPFAQVHDFKPPE
jgi:hypothetical protein